MMSSRVIKHDPHHTFSSILQFHIISATIHFGHIQLLQTISYLEIPTFSQLVLKPQSLRYAQHKSFINSNDSNMPGLPCPPHQLCVPDAYMMGL
ncbi:unnamed protein product [Larinioides sclopetarius]|uniref:Uncharacterized protein n=1 Tax=Larinioides sclopetarius TaxID=280406 RepID=A0AAV2BZP8_9ARAC